MGEDTELRRSRATHNKIMHKFYDQSLVRYRYKQKQNLWAT